MITTSVVPHLCSRCHRLTLTGWAEGLHARVDPIPLNRTGHLDAILTGRWTYRLTRTGLVHLDADRIPDNRITGPIVTEHQCAKPIPEHHRDTTTAPPTTTTTEGIPY